MNKNFYLSLALLSSALVNNAQAIDTPYYCKCPCPVFVSNSNELSTAASLKSGAYYLTVSQINPSNGDDTCASIPNAPTLKQSSTGKILCSYTLNTYDMDEGKKIRFQPISFYYPKLITNTVSSAEFDKLYAQQANKIKNLATTFIFNFCTLDSDK
ncbi:MAG: hypothetical protein IT292_07845 [Deltaproteobacteria bacterium]|nr:hypothetical protein [Deltaproteobacteria bacterium]